ncbi:MAG TPA: alternative ribosome rescue aminoacyl-tRNA hydrolase ArfB [Jatrophihabitantaceae bacterium]|nr:alternative ribosome rescue aminoacyl-tRNA hydrolase ArfB [Jatrophihabitantaceae bacterium]
MSEIVLRPGRGYPDGLVVPSAELIERFSRSSGPGGQSVNTTDSRVELRWDVAHSTALSDAQRTRLLDRLSGRLVDGVLSIAASEHRSQLQNRQAARARLAALLRDALEPPSPARRPTRPSRAAQQRRVDAKRRRSQVKVTRRRPPLD